MSVISSRSDHNSTIDSIRYSLILHIAFATILIALQISIRSASL